MGQPKPVTIGSQTFCSMKEAAAHFDVSATTVKNLARSNELDRLLVGLRKGKKPVTIGSLTFTSRREAAAHFKVCPETITKLSRKGQLDRLLTGDHYKRRNIIVQGMTFDTVEQAASHFNIDPITVCKYFDQGELEGYINTKEEYNGSNAILGLPCSWRNHKFPSQTALARALGYPSSTVWYHLNKKLTADLIEPREGSALWEVSENRKAAIGECKPLSSRY